MSTELPEGRVEILALAGLPEVRVGADLEAMIGDALAATPDALPFRDGAFAKTPPWNSVLDSLRTQDPDRRGAGRGRRRHRDTGRGSADGICRLVVVGIPRQASFIWQSVGPPNRPAFDQSVANDLFAPATDYRLSGMGIPQRRLLRWAF